MYTRKTLKRRKSSTRRSKLPIGSKRKSVSKTRRLTKKKSRRNMSTRKSSRRRNNLYIMKGGRIIDVNDMDDSGDDENLVMEQPRTVGRLRQSQLNPFEDLLKSQSA